MTSSQKYTKFRCGMFESHGHLPITHVCLLRSDEAQKDRSQSLPNSSRIDTVQLLCEQCVFAMNNSNTTTASPKEGDRHIVPIDSFLREAKAESSQNIFDLNKQSPLYSLFEQKKNQILVTLAKLSSRIATFATLMKSKELREGTDRLLNQNLITQNLSQQEFVMQRIFAIEGNNYVNQTEFEQFVKEVAEGSAKNKAVITHYEQSKREEDIALKEIELIQLRLSVEATRIFQFLDKDLQAHVSQKLMDYITESGRSPHSEAIVAALTEESLLDDPQRFTHIDQKISKLFSSGSKILDAVVQGSNTNRSNKGSKVEGTPRMTRSAAAAAAKEKMSLSTPLQEAILNAAALTAEQTQISQSRSLQSSAIKATHNHNSFSATKSLQSNALSAQKSNISTTGKTSVSSNVTNVESQAASAKKISAAIFASIFPSSTKKMSPSLLQQQSSTLNASGVPANSTITSLPPDQPSASSQTTDPITMSVEDFNYSKKPHSREDDQDNDVTISNSIHRYGSTATPRQNSSSYKQQDSTTFHDEEAQYDYEYGEHYEYDDECDKENQIQMSKQQQIQYLQQHSHLIHDGDAKHSQAGGQLLVVTQRSPSDKRKERRLRKREQKKLKKLRLQQEMQIEQNQQMIKLRQLDAERKASLTYAVQSVAAAAAAAASQGNGSSNQNNGASSVVPLGVVTNPSNQPQSSIGMSQSQLQHSILAASISPQKSSSFRYSSIDKHAKQQLITPRRSINIINSNIAVVTGSAATDMLLLTPEPMKEINNNNFETLLNSFKSQNSTSSHLKRKLADKLFESARSVGSALYASQSAQQQQSRSAMSSAVQQSQAQSLQCSATANNNSSQSKLPLWNVGCFEGDISPSLSSDENNPKKRIKKEEVPSQQAQQQQQQVQQQQPQQQQSQQQQATPSIVRQQSLQLHMQQAQQRAAAAAAAAAAANATIQTNAWSVPQDTQQQQQQQQTTGSAIKNVIKSTGERVFSMPSKDLQSKHTNRFLTVGQSAPARENTLDYNGNRYSNYSNPFLMGHQNNNLNPTNTAVQNTTTTSLIRPSQPQPNHDSNESNNNNSNSKIGVGSVQDQIDFTNQLKEQLEKKMREESINGSMYQSSYGTKRLQFQLQSSNRQLYQVQTRQQSNKAAAVAVVVATRNLRSSVDEEYVDEFDTPIELEQKQNQQRQQQHRFDDISPILYSPGVHFSPMNSEEDCYQQQQQQLLHQQR